MQYLVLIFFILFNLNLSAKSKCSYWQGISDVLSPGKFKRLTLGREHVVELESIDQARNVMLKLPGNDSWGFDISANNPAREVYYEKLSSSAMKNQPVGFQIHKKSKDGHIDTMRVRVDWDPSKQAHVNVEYFVHENGHKNAYKVALKFKCEGHPCSEKEVMKLVKSNFNH